MPAAGFKARFAPPVITGEKLTTIRKGSRWKVGDRFVGYYGLRFLKEPVLLAESTVRECDLFEIITEEIDGMVYAVVKVCRASLPKHAVKAIARCDGFDGITDFLAFFIGEHGLPFKGQLIRWNKPLHCGDAEAVRLKLQELRNALRKPELTPGSPAHGLTTGAKATLLKSKRKPRGTFRVTNITTDTITIT